MTRTAEAWRAARKGGTVASPAKWALLPGCNSCRRSHSLGTRAGGIFRLYGGGRQPASPAARHASRPVRPANLLGLALLFECAVLRQVGTEKQPLRPNREIKLRVHRTGRGDPLSVVGVDRTTSVAVEGHKPGREVYPQRPAGRGRANGHVDEVLRTGLGTSYHAG